MQFLYRLSERLHFHAKERSRQTYYPVYEKVLEKNRNSCYIVLAAKKRHKILYFPFLFYGIAAEYEGRKNA